MVIVSVRGMSCILNYTDLIAPLVKVVIVPVRGMSCIATITVSLTPKVSGLSSP